MPNDHLDKETSVSVAVTETGVKGGAKSRTIAAIDRLGGNLLELLNVPLEKRSARARAVIAGEERLLEAAVSATVEKLKVDPQLAARVIEKYFDGIFRERQNTDAVLVQAIEDLRSSPGTAEAESGPVELEEPFLSRFEGYAKEASSEELRQKWGRVLASEIRKPGTFSGKALRLVDELDATTALLFERVCKSRLREILPKFLVGTLLFAEVADLTAAGLLVQPSVAGQINRARDVTDGSGTKLWLFEFGEWACGFRHDAKWQGATVIKTASQTGEPALPVYVLTQVGAAIATILPDQQEQAFAAFIQKLKSELPTTDNVRELRSDGSMYRLIATHQGTLAENNQDDK